MKFLMLGFVAAGTLAGFGISYLVTPVWRTTAALRIEKGAPADLLQNSTDAVMSRHSLASIVNRLGLYVKERRSTPLEEVVGRMRRGTQIQTMPIPPEVFTIQFDYSDPVKAVEATNTMMSTFALAAKTRDKAYITVVELPTVPKQSLRPKGAAITLAGTDASLAALLTALARRRRAA